MSTCFTYDVEKQTWDEIAGLPSRKYAGSNMMLDNHLYFFGGIDYYFEQTTFDYTSYELLPMIDGTYYDFMDNDVGFKKIAKSRCVLNL